MSNISCSIKTWYKESDREDVLLATWDFIKKGKKSWDTIREHVQSNWEFFWYLNKSKIIKFWNKPCTNDLNFKAKLMCYWNTWSSRTNATFHKVFWWLYLCFCSFSLSLSLPRTLWGADGLHLLSPIFQSKYIFPEVDEILNINRKIKCIKNSISNNRIINTSLPATV